MSTSSWQERTRRPHDRRGQELAERTDLPAGLGLGIGCERMEGTRHARSSVDDWGVPLEPGLEQTLLVLGGVLRDIAGNPSLASAAEADILASGPSTSLDHSVSAGAASSRSSQPDTQATT